MDSSVPSNKNGCTEIILRFIIVGIVPLIVYDRTINPDWFYYNVRNMRRIR